MFIDWFCLCLTGKSNVPKFPSGCRWKPRLQEPVLRHHPWRRQGARVTPPPPASSPPLTLHHDPNSLTIKLLF